MPRKEINDYSFYKIVCLDNSVELCYIGSTANFKSRKRSHKYACNNENCKQHNCKLYKTIRENGGWDNFKMIEIGKREHLTTREAEHIEEEYRQELKANMNSIRCFISPEQLKENRKEYKQANKEHISEIWKNYYVEHKEKLNNDSKEYYEENKEKILEKKKNSYDKEKRRQRYLAEKEAKNKK